MNKRTCLSVFALLFLTLISGCASPRIRAYVQSHPELTQEDVWCLHHQEVRPNQTMGMVRFMLGTPFRQVAPGQPKDILFYWSPNEKPENAEHGINHEENQHALDQAMKIMKHAIPDQRGTLRVIYFINGRVVNEEVRPNVYQTEMDKIVSEGFFAVR